MPGSNRCARCGALLALATAEINVHPPRATPWQKAAGWWRVRVLAGRAWRAIVPANAPLWISAANETFRSISSTALRGIVPGWANFYLGQRRLGWLLLVCFLLTMIPVIVFWGSTLSILLLGLAVGIHTASVLAAVLVRVEGIGSRLTVIGGCCIALFLLVYLPIIIGVSRLISPLTINQNMPPLFAGDIVWRRAVSQVLPQQLVLYRGQPMQFPVAGQQYPLYVAGGPRAARILAIEQQAIEWRGGQLIIDDTPVPGSMPTANSEVGDSIIVPAGHVLLDATAIPAAGYQLVPKMWQKLAIIPLSNVDGVIMYRAWPPTRLGFIN